MLNKRLLLIIFLLAMPIVKADGCGLTCPSTDKTLLGFTLKFICIVFTWSFCHLISFLIMLFIVIIIIIWLYFQSDKKKKKMKIYFYFFAFLFGIIILYPYIHAWVYTSPSQPLPSTTTTTTIPSTPCDNPSNEPDVSGDESYSCYISTYTVIDRSGNGVFGEPNNNEDYYNFNVNPGNAHVEIQILNGGDNWKIYMKDADNYFPPNATECTDGSTGCCGTTDCTIDVSNPGNAYYVAILGTSTTNYNVSINFVPA